MAKEKRKREPVLRFSVAKMISWCKVRHLQCPHVLKLQIVNGSALLQVTKKKSTTTLCTTTEKHITYQSPSKKEPDPHNYRKSNIIFHYIYIKESCDFIAARKKTKLSVQLASPMDLYKGTQCRMKWRGQGMLLLRR